MRRVVLADLVNCQDVWMIERDYRVRFLLKPLQALRVPSKAHRQEFECGLAARDHVGGQIDFAHSTASDPLGNFVVTDCLTNWRMTLLILNHLGRETNS